MTQEVMYETGKRKNRANKAGKPAERSAEQDVNQTNYEENTPGWEEQLWMNQADAVNEELPTVPASNAPSVEMLQEQWGKVRGQVENGFQSLFNQTQLGDSADSLRVGLNNVMSDERSREELKRWSALVGGGFLALVGLRRSLGSLTLMGLGAGLVYYALTGRWPLPGGGQQRGRASAPHTGRVGSTTLDSNRPITTQNIIVKAPIAAVYQAWADFENFPNFMQHICSVTKTGDRTSHWVMEGPLNSRIEWDAETTRLEENKRVAWSSTDGQIKTSGQVTFNPLSNDEVEVTVMLRYVPPAGVVGDFFANLFADPEGKLAEDLYNFKRYIEKPARVAEATDDR